MVHKHITFEGGRTKKAQIYPKEFCRAICVGLQKQIQADKLGQFLLMEAETTGTTSEDLMKVAKELKQKYETVEEPEDETLDVA